MRFLAALPFLLVAYVCERLAELILDEQDQ